jgi:hypothetical protein
MREREFSARRDARRISFDDKDFLNRARAAAAAASQT